MRVSKKIIAVMLAASMSATAVSSLSLSVFAATPAETVITQNFDDSTLWNLSEEGDYKNSGAFAVSAKDRGEGKYVDYALSNVSGGRGGVFTLPSAATADYVTVEYDWMTTGVSNGRDAGTTHEGEFILADTSLNTIMSLSVVGPARNNAILLNGVDTGLQSKVFDNGTQTSEPTWYHIKAVLDFQTKKIVAVTITDTSLEENNTYTASAVPFITAAASNVGKTILNAKRAGGVNMFWTMGLDEFNVEKSATSEVTLTIKDQNSDVVPEADVIIGTQTLTADAQGVVKTTLPAGDLALQISKVGYRPYEGTLTVTGEDASQDISVTKMDYEPGPDTIEITGGSEYVYKPASGSNTSEAFTAKVIDKGNYELPEEKVSWTIEPPVAGVSIDENGVVSVSSETVVESDDGIDVTIKATSVTEGTVANTAQVHIRNVAVPSMFDVFGLAAVKAGGATASYSTANLKDQYGEEMTGGDYTFTFSVTGDAATMENGVLTTKAITGAEEKVTVTATCGEKSVTRDVVVYSYDYYEPAKGYSVNDTTIGRIEELGKGDEKENVLIWPRTQNGTGTHTLTFPETVELEKGKAKEFTWKQAWSGGTVSAQGRRMVLKDSTGKEICTPFAYVGTQIGLGETKASGSYTLDTVIGSMGNDGVWNEGHMIIKTLPDGSSKATIWYGDSGTVEVALADGITNIAQIEFFGEKSAPDARLLAIKDIKIQDIDAEALTINGDEQFAKIEGKTVTRQYEAEALVVEEGETFTWSIEGVATADVVFENIEAAEASTAVAVIAQYDQDGKLAKIETQEKALTEGTNTVKVSAAAGSKVMLWNSLESQVPYAAAQTADAAAAPDLTGITIDPQTGVLTVTDDANPAVINIVCTSSVENKSATKTVAVEDFANIASFDILGDSSIEVTDTETEHAYTIANVIDEYGDDVSDMFNAPVWSTDAEGIATIDPSTGVLTIVGEGKVMVSATIGNSGKTKKIDKEVMIGTSSKVVTEFTGNSTEIDVSDLTFAHTSGMYSVTVLKTDDTSVQSEVQATDNKVTVDTTDAAKVEISPIWTYTEVGNVEKGKALGIPNGVYNFTFTKATTDRGDILVNDILVGQNVDQHGEGRDVKGNTVYEVKDIKVNAGDAVVSMTDGQKTLTDIKVTKAPSILERKTHVYVLGDSLVSTYYGEYTKVNGEFPAPGDARSGWGQMIDNFFTDDVVVTNLAASGSYALLLYNPKDAFESVIANAEPGDVLLLECGYNDAEKKSNGTQNGTVEQMDETVRAMIAESREKGVIPVLITPNASGHDYKPDVKRSGTLRTIAEETNTFIIDLAAKSYEFLSSNYESADTAKMNYNLAVAPDDKYLHSSYMGAMKWAEVVAQGIYDLQTAGATDAEGKDLSAIAINKDYAFSFVDTVGQTIEMQIKDAQ